MLKTASSIMGHERIKHKHHMKLKDKDIVSKPRKKGTYDSDKILSLWGLNINKEALTKKILKLKKSVNTNKSNNNDSEVSKKVQKEEGRRSEPKIHDDEKMNITHDPDNNMFVIHSVVSVTEEEDDFSAASEYNYEDSQTEKEADKSMSLVSIDHNKTQTVYICNLCEHIFVNKVMFLKHKKMHRFCQFCNSKFNSNISLMNHIKACPIQVCMSSRPVVNLSNIAFSKRIREEYQQTFTYAQIPDINTLTEAQTRATSQEIDKKDDDNNLETEETNHANNTKVIEINVEVEEGHNLELKNQEINIKVEEHSPATKAKNQEINIKVEEQSNTKAKSRAINTKVKEINSEMKEAQVSKYNNSQDEYDKMFNFGRKLDISKIKSFKIKKKRPEIEISKDTPQDPDLQPKKKWSRIELRNDETETPTPSVSISPIRTTNNTSDDAKCLPKSIEINSPRSDPVFIKFTDSPNMELFTIPEAIPKRHYLQESNYDLSLLNLLCASVPNPNIFTYS